MIRRRYEIGDLALEWLRRREEQERRGAGGPPAAETPPASPVTARPSPPGA